VYILHSGAKSLHQSDPNDHVVFKAKKNEVHHIKPLAKDPDFFFISDLFKYLKIHIVFLNKAQIYKQDSCCAKAFYFCSSKILQIFK
jgi:hypothetical protein